MTTWEMFEYDVWGNADDGYDVNCAYDSHITVEFDAELSDREIIATLQASGALRSDLDIDLIDINGDSSVITFDYDGRPEFELRRL